MKYLKILTLVLVIVASALFIKQSLVSNQVSQALGGTYAEGANVMYSINTATSTTVGTGSALVLATSTGRTWALIANDGTGAVTCNYSRAASTTTGFQIAAGSTKRLGDAELFTGGVFCASATGSNLVYVLANQ